MSNNANNRSEKVANNVLPENKTPYNKFRKAVINTVYPIRQNWISNQFKKQDKYNDWSENLTLSHNHELKRLKEEIADAKSANKELREDLAIIKRIFLIERNSFPDRKKEDTKESEVVEQKEKIETVPSESSQEETAVVDESEKENPVSEDPKEKKRGFFAKLFKRKPSKAVEKNEVFSVPSSEKRGFLARIFTKRPAE